MDLGRNPNSTLIHQVTLNKSFTLLRLGFYFCKYLLSRAAYSSNKWVEEYQHLVSTCLYISETEFIFPIKTLRQRGCRTVSKVMQ